MSSSTQQNYLVIGAGFSGAVLARELATQLDCHVTVVEARSHVAGNCHTARDAVSGRDESPIWPAYFQHESAPCLGDYVNRFGVLLPYTNRVKASTSRGIFSFPINLHTINHVFWEEARSDRRARVPRIAGRQEHRRTAQLRGAGAEIYRTRTLRDFFLRLHAQAVGLRTVRIAGVDSQTTADPFQLRRYLLQQRAAGNSRARLHRHRGENPRSPGDHGEAVDAF